MSRYVQDEGPAKKFADVRLDGGRLTVVTGKVGGAEKRQEKDFDSPGTAKAARDRLVRELLGRGFIEAGPGGVPEIPAHAPGPDTGDGYLLAEILEEAPAPVAAVAPSLAAEKNRAPGHDKTSAARKKARRRKKKGRGGEGEPGGRWVVAALASIAAGFVGLAGFLAWTLLGPSSIIGTWQAPNLFQRDENNLLYIKPAEMFHFDEQGNAYRVLGEGGAWSAGTYTLDGGNLVIRFVREGFWGDSESEGFANSTDETVTYHCKVSRSWLTLRDAGDSEVSLMRLREKQLHDANALLARVPAASEVEAFEFEPDAFDEEPPFEPDAFGEELPL